MYRELHSTPHPLGVPSSPSHLVFNLYADTVACGSDSILKNCEISLLGSGNFIASIRGLLARGVLFAGNCAR